jgi:uncharacterized membrane protein
LVAENVCLQQQLLVLQRLAAQADDTKNEKCYGVAKAGQNDCATASNSCAGTTTTDSQKDAFLYVPVGICQKIAGGSLKPKI